MGTLLCFTDQIQSHPCSVHRCIQSSALEIKCGFHVVLQESECYVPESLCAPVSWELMVSLKVLSPLLPPRSVRDSCRLIFLMRSISGGMGGRDEGGGGAATVKPPCQRHKSKSRTLHAASWFIWYPLWLLDKVMHFQGRRPLKTIIECVNIFWDKY